MVREAISIPMLIAALWMTTPTATIAEPRITLNRLPQRSLRYGIKGTAATEPIAMEAEMRPKVALVG